LKQSVSHLSMRLCILSLSGVTRPSVKNCFQHRRGLEHCISYIIIRYQPRPAFAKAAMHINDSSQQATSPPSPHITQHYSSTSSQPAPHTAHHSRQHRSQHRTPQITSQQATSRPAPHTADHIAAGNIAARTAHHRQHRSRHIEASTAHHRQHRSRQTSSQHRTSQIRAVRQRFRPL
jgi:hypothetical protein